jgi:hypothetical protein
MVNNTNNNNIVEENKKNVLSVQNFDSVIRHNNTNTNTNLKTDLKGNLDELFESENFQDDNDIEDIEHIEDINKEGKTNSSLEVVSNEEVIDESDLEELQSSDTANLLQGGVRNTEIDIIYNIDYILVDDEKLINPEKVYKNVDTYINNYNSIEMQKYKKNFKQLYQSYSTKNYTITMVKYKSTSKIIVTKNDKTKKIVKELIKPQYLFYDEDNNLLKIKRNISNERTELLYKYETLIAKLNITPEDKKAFEKERSNFIENLETYYTYTLYHKKINKIITTNKSNLVLQKEISVYKENNDYESKILNSNIYSIDNNVIDTINKQNSDNLINFNNIMLSLSGKKDKDITKDKKTIESIKTYLKQRQEIESSTKSLSNNTDIQDEYINYIILELP